MKNKFTSTQEKEKPLRVVYRPEKGLKMEFFSGCVTKNYSLELKNSHISHQEQTRRIEAEIQAYQKFNRLNCPFVPKLIDYSIEQRWLCIERINGNNLLELFQLANSNLSFQSLLEQIKVMASWLQENSFPSMSSNVKDLILDEEGRLYLIDFEPYSPQAKGAREKDFYNSLIKDLADRIVLGQGRRVRLSWQVINFALCIMRKSIFASMWWISFYGYNRLRLFLKGKLRPLRSVYNLFQRLFFGTKPKRLSWKDYATIQLSNILYQPLLFSDGTVINKRSSSSIIDSRDKLKTLEFPKDFSGKTFLDIGCAEGFFVIEAAKRGALMARGCDITSGRIKIAEIVNRSWDFKNQIKFLCAGLFNIPSEWDSDIVSCLAVCHHLHGNRNHDTWEIISNPKKYSQEFANMLRAVEKVSSLTKEMTYWEYCYEYNKRPDNVDYNELGKIWQDHGFYRKVEFRGLSQNSPQKDRAIYHAYK